MFALRVFVCLCSLLLMLLLLFCCFKVYVLVNVSKDTVEKIMVATRDVLT